METRPQALATKKDYPEIKVVVIGDLSHTNQFAKQMQLKKWWVDNTEKPTKSIFSDDPTFRLGRINNQLQCQLKFNFPDLSRKENDKLNEEKIKNADCVVYVGGIKTDHQALLTLNEKCLHMDMQQFAEEQFENFLREKVLYQKQKMFVDKYIEKQAINLKYNNIVLTGTFENFFNFLDRLRISKADIDKSKFNYLYARNISEKIKFDKALAELNEKKSNNNLVVDCDHENAVAFFKFKYAVRFDTKKDLFLQSEAFKNFQLYEENNKGIYVEWFLKVNSTKAVRKVRGIINNFQEEDIHTQMQEINTAIELLEKKGHSKEARPMLITLRDEMLRWFMPTIDDFPVNFKEYKQPSNQQAPSAPIMPFKNM